MCRKMKPAVKSAVQESVAGKADCLATLLEPKGSAQAVHAYTPPHANTHDTHTQHPRAAVAQ